VCPRGSRSSRSSSDRPRCACRQSFNVLAAVGRDEPGRLQAVADGRLPAPHPGRLGAVLLAARRAARARRHGLRPGGAQRRREPVPAPRGRAPELRLCELHVRRSLENALAPLADQPQHPVQLAFRHGLYQRQLGPVRAPSQTRPRPRHAAPARPGALARQLREEFPDQKVDRPTTEPHIRRGRIANA
jgi:hypothetical protein